MALVDAHNGSWVPPRIERLPVLGCPPLRPRAMPLGSPPVGGVTSVLTSDWLSRQWRFVHGPPWEFSSNAPSSLLEPSHNPPCLTLPVDVRPERREIGRASCRESG